ncbi:MAG: phenylalanine--tRNA ligase subunit alpha [Candidatus Nitronauta litoralis]|uniref:Phenylalanine--tRNA ligase alpha subunit n=1 Tax=Candidatus Nitronauta litoralis TaxID=2705533 RepID=A0A7T0BV17_9BACT|nr:MAG: phenylalanine--tRNA ligase subunit alpha [Candidatus Nitronauta litoralis]
MTDPILNIRKLFDKQLGALVREDQLRQLKADFIGKKGRVTLLMKELKSLPSNERKEAGKNLNEVKTYIEAALQEKNHQLKSATANDKNSAFDFTLPGRKNGTGHSHPVTQVMEEIISIFNGMGFNVEEGPQIESDYYNFEALNIPKDHPARDMQDTFYIGGKVLRTHTSPVQIHVMERQPPPLRIIAPGKVYRCDSDVSHTPMFHQIEGLMVDRDVRFSDLKGVIEIFLKEVFGANVKVRFRPSFFPFTCPSAEVDIQCAMCSGKGCRSCSQTGWLEILGAGMVDPAVFGFVDYDPEEWSGFAFGLGIERIAMLKFGINDIRLYFENDIRFLQQF